MFHFSSECLDDIPEIQYSSNNWASEKGSSKAVDTVVTYTCLADTSKTVTARCDQGKFRWLADSMECPKPAGFVHYDKISLIKTLTSDCPDDPPAAPTGTTSDWDGQNKTGGHVVRYNCTGDGGVTFTTSTCNAVWTTPDTVTCPSGESLEI